MHISERRPEEFVRDLRLPEHDPDQHRKTRSYRKRGQLLLGRRMQLELDDSPGSLILPRILAILPMILVILPRILAVIPKVLSVSSRVLLVLHGVLSLEGSIHYLWVQLELVILKRKRRWPSGLRYMLCLEPSVVSSNPDPELLGAGISQGFFDMSIPQAQSPLTPLENLIL